jgi:VWFA-related protein
MLSQSAQKKFRWISILLILVMGALHISPALAQTIIDTVVHYVDGKPSETDISYEVTAFVSVADSTGNPIKDLKAGDFTVTEDSQKVELLSAELAQDEPINLVLVMDTSGSMTGAPIADAKTAASNFIAGLGKDDRVAVVVFNDTMKTVIDFTTDHKAARDELSLVDAMSGAGTCLFDAAYQAVKMTATVPSGRRAVVLFTDGVDEKAGSGGVCSIHTASDVIDLASDSGTRTPIYTLGMGAKIDQNSLKRLAEDTGGRFLYSPDSSQLDTVFIRLSDSLRSQYAIKYSSKAGPGSHTLAVTAKYLSAQDTDTRNFLLPNFPLRLTFVEPKDGGEISGTVTLKVETFGQGETIQAVVFQANGATVASVEKTPYEAQVDFSSYKEGNLTLEAIAQGADGIELARASQTVKVVPTLPTPEPVEPKTDYTLFFILGGLGLLFILVVVVVIIIFARRKKQKERDDEWNRKVGGVGDLPTMEEGIPGSDRTMDSWEMPPDALGRLLVTASDDSSMVGQHFDITSRRTTLGRKADNDIIFPKDTPVSRHHALIEERNGSLFLTEVVDSETNKPPTYGTFVNDSKVGSQAILLETGDEIRLGNRAILKFEAGKILSGNDTTHDDFLAPGDTMATQDQN